MAHVRVTIPTMLAALVAGSRRFQVDALDLDGVLEAIFALHPELRVHILDEQGAVRPHILLFHNNAQVAGRTATVVDGDEVTVLQAVSGG